MTSGIMSQVGRVLELGGGEGTVFDQTTVPAFPGSSGGGVFLREDAEADAGKCVGLLVRGAGENFNLIVPIRRMHRWATENDVEWALDPSIEAPPLEEILKMSPEGSGGSKPKEGKFKRTGESLEFDFLLKRKTNKSF